MREALAVRGVPETTAHLAAELGVLAFKRGYTAWLDADHDERGLAPYARQALDDLRAASASLG
jgi:hypothetical protein